MLKLTLGEICIEYKHYWAFHRGKSQEIYKAIMYTISQRIFDNWLLLYRWAEIIIQVKIP